MEKNCLLAAEITWSRLCWVQPHYRFIVLSYHAQLLGRYTLCFCSHRGIHMHRAQTRARKWGVLSAVWILSGQGQRPSAHRSALLLLPELTADRSTRGGSSIRVSHTREGDMLVLFRTARLLSSPKRPNSKYGNAPETINHWHMILSGASVSPFHFSIELVCFKSLTLVATP